MTTSSDQIRQFTATQADTENPTKKRHNNTMHRSPAGCGFTLTVAGQGPVIVDVIATDVMPEYPSTPIAEVKRRLITGMAEFMDGDPEKPDGDFDCGYKQDDVDRCSAIVDAYLHDIAAVNRASKSDILLVIKDVVLKLNELNAKCGRGLIETDQREDLCEIILVAAQQYGLSTTDDVTEEWREW